MLRTHLARKLFTYVLLALSLTFIHIQPVNAASDDPGMGRLSGQYISEDFYDSEGRLELPKYGAGITAKNAYTGKTYTHQERFNDRAIMNGIDVSQWQGKSIDWESVKADGIDFAFVRVGFRGYGDAGTLSNDIYYDLNMENATNAGVGTGIYIYSQAITPDEAVEEANYILERIGTHTVTMPIVLDYEYASAGNGLTGRLYKAKLSKEDATAVCLAFCNTIAEAGYVPMVYANKSMLTDQLNPADITAQGYRIWLANYTTSTTYTRDYDFWQYAENGKINGILDNKGNKADVDMDFYYARETDNFIPITNSIALGSFSQVADQLYTGTAITPEISVTYNGITLIPGQDYTVTYSDNIEPGTAYIKIQGMGNYHGVKSIPFNIMLNEVANFSVKKKTTNYITLSWSAGQGISGYELYRSTAIDGEYKLLKKITNKSTTSYKNTKLNPGQCYYYKIRCYKKESSGPAYGDFSSVLSVCTKAEYKRNALAKSGTIIYDTPTKQGVQLAEPEKNDAMSVSYSTKDAVGSTWYYVTYDTDYETFYGFVPAGKVTIAKVGKIVKTKSVNVRKSYSAASKKLTTLKKNKKVNVLSTKKRYGVTWYKVRFKKDEKTYNGWISAPYVKIQ